MQPEIIVRAATENDLPFVSQGGYFPDPIVRRKVGDGDVFLAIRGEVSRTGSLHGAA